MGYVTLGTGAVSWFDPSTPTSQLLISEFDEFFYPGNSWSLARQLAWIDAQLARHAGGPIFLFLNIGETHVPYYYEGAPWAREDNPCVPFQTDAIVRPTVASGNAPASNSWMQALAALLARFSGATIVLCGDHGDCWGEDGLWEHGISHPMTLTVPLSFACGASGSADREVIWRGRSGLRCGAVGPIEEFLKK